MSVYVPPIDTLADDLLAAINAFPVERPFSRDPARGEPERRIAEAYNRLYCELHDKVPSPEAGRSIKAKDALAAAPSSPAAKETR